MQQLLTHTPLTWHSSISMRTQGEIEAAVSKALSHFEQDCIGRGPKNIPLTCSGISSPSVSKAF